MRPRDWGEQNLDDASFSVPDDPVEGFSETEVDPNDSTKGQGIVLEYLDTFNPDEDLEPDVEPLPARHAWMGLLLEDLSADGDTYKTFKVALQSGEIVQATCQQFFEQDTWKEQDPCIVVRGNVEDTYYVYFQRYGNNPGLYELVTIPQADTSMDNIYKANAYPVAFDFETMKYKRMDSDDYSIIYFPTMKMTNPNSPGPTNYAAGQRVYANNNNGILEAITPPLTLWRFEMENSLGKGGGAYANPIFYDEAGQEISTDIVPTILVYDSLGVYSKPQTAAGGAKCRGYAQYWADCNTWSIVSMSLPGDFWGELTTDLYKTSASKNDVKFKAYINGTDVLGLSVDSNVTVYNPPASSNYLLEAPAGTRLLCRWDVVQAYYYFDSNAASGDIPFELYDDITPGGSNKTAWRLKSDLSRDSTQIVVSDGILGDVRARGTSSTTTGAKGFCQLLSDGKYHIKSIQRQAKMCFAKVKTLSGDYISEVEEVVPMDDGQSPVNSSSDTLAIDSTNDPYPGNVGDNGVIAFNSSSGYWHALSFPCRTST